LLKVFCRRMIIPSMMNKVTMSNRVTMANKLLMNQVIIIL
jgi:hypothetical protein